MIFRTPPPPGSARGEASTSRFAPPKRGTCKGLDRTPPRGLRRAVQATTAEADALLLGYFAASNLLMFNSFRRLLLFLLGFTIPIQGFSLSLGPIRATPFKLVSLPFFLLAGVILASRRGSRPPDAKTVWLVVFGFSYAIAQVLSLVSGLSLSGVLRDGTTMLALVVYYLVLSLVMKDHKDLRLFVWAVVLSAIVTVLPSVLGVYGASVQFSYGQRYQGLAGQENLLGAEMTVAFAFALAAFFSSGRLSRKVVAAGGAAFALMGVALSLSRSAFVAIGVMWLFWVYRSGRTGTIRYAIPALLLGLAALVATPESVENRFETMTDPAQRQKDSSVQGRFTMGLWAVRALASNPLLGVGANRFAAWVHEQPGTSGMPWHTIHNAYLYIGAEQGLLGLIPFLALLILSWRDYSRCWRLGHARRGLRDERLQEYTTYALYLQLGLLSLMVGGLFHQQHRLKSLWTVMALSPVLMALVRARLQELRAQWEVPDESRAPTTPADGHSLAPSHARVG